MKAIQLSRERKLHLVDIPVPQIAPDQLLVKTGAATICTSDLNDIRENPFDIPLPVIIGHEAAGTIAAIGAAVRGFRAGDRVAAHPVHPCGACASCTSGMGHLCTNMGHFGITMQGTFAEYFVVRADRVRQIPEAVPFAAAALLEPVCVCLEALTQAKVKPGGSLCIIGDGPFGVLMSRLSPAFSPSSVVLMGRHDFRLSFAPDAVVRINSSISPEPVTEALRHAGRAGFDAVIQAVGSRRAITDGLDMIRPKGRLVVFSAISGLTEVDMTRVHVKELEIVGACNDDDMMDRAVDALIDPAMEIGKLVTHRFKIGDLQQAFELAEKGREEAMKVAIEFQ